MLPPGYNSSALSDEARWKLTSFYERFCADHSPDRQGPGHLLYACYAAVPLLLTPELANLIWINFRSYAFTSSGTEKIEQVAVTDLLLSVLCRQTGHRQYEIDAEVRSYLLHLLKDGRWFARCGIRTGGIDQLKELAFFLRQYVRGRSEVEYDAAGFRQLNEWAALAFLDPAQLAWDIAGVLQDDLKKDNRHAQMWLNLQMGRIAGQFEYEVRTEAEKSPLRSFYNLYYYTEARKAEWLRKPEDVIYASSSRIESNVEVPAGRTAGTIRLPMPKKVAERTERKLNNVQRVLALLVGIDIFADTSIPPLRSCVSDAHFLHSSLQSLESTGELKLDTRLLMNEAATFEAIIRQMAEIYKDSHPEDIVVFYYASHMENDNVLYCYDSIRSSRTNVFDSNNFYKELEKVKAGSIAQTVFIFDACSGPNWSPPAGDIFLGASRDLLAREGIFDNRSAGIFSYFLSRIIHTQPAVSYRDLTRWLRHLSEKHGQAPLCLTGQPAFQDRLFLRRMQKRPAITDALLAYDETSASWLALDEDLILLPLGMNAGVYAYDSPDPLPKEVGVLFQDADGNIRFGGSGYASLNPSLLYTIKPEKPLLKVYLVATPVQELSGVLKEVQFDKLSPWRGIFIFETETLDPEQLHGEQSDPLSQAIVRMDTDPSNPDGYTAFAIIPGQQEGPTPELRRKWAINDAGLLEEFLIKLSHYAYLTHLSLQSKGHPGYESLDVVFEVKWGNALSDMQGKERTRSMNETSFYIDKGRIHFHPLEITVRNKENLPVYFELYIVGQDLSIRKVADNTDQMLFPGNFRIIVVQEPALFEQMAIDDSFVHLKLVVSYDPISTDFSQKGFNT